MARGPTNGDKVHANNDLPGSTLLPIISDIEAYNTKYTLYGRRCNAYMTLGVLESKENKGSDRASSKSSIERHAPGHKPGERESGTWL